MNGLVTTATVRMPRSFASDATTGAAPVPVPPPSPAVMKTMSAPSSSRVIVSGSSSAAPLPTSGLEPAPSPWVSLAPSWIFTGAGEARSACRSVLATMKSTPVNSAAIMRLTALPPPPPRPITLIFAAGGTSSSSKSGRRVRSFSIESSPDGTAVRRRPARVRFPSPAAPAENSGACRSPAGGRPPLEDFTEPSGQAPSQPREDGAVVGVDGRRTARLAARAVEGQSDPGAVDGGAHDVGQATDLGRNPPAHGLVEDCLGQLGHAFHDRAAARHHHPGGGRALEAGLGQVARDQREDLLHARLDDLRQHLP